MAAQEESDIEEFGACGEKGSRGRGRVDEQKRSSVRRGSIEVCGVEAEN